jgi:hypothetical protein
MGIWLAAQLLKRSGALLLEFGQGGQALPVVGALDLKTSPDLTTHTFKHSLGCLDEFAVHGYLLR